MATQPQVALRPSPDYRFPAPGERQLVFAGSTAWRDTSEPWFALGKVTARALAPHGYEVKILPEPWGSLNPRFVGDGRADVGATSVTTVRDAHLGKGAFAQEGRRDHLRVLATICRPSWLAIAVTRDSGITDLTQIKERKLPVRMLLGAGGDEILAHYGMTRQDIVSWGGRDVDGHLERGGLRLDLIIHPLYLANTTAAYRWLEASVINDLRFLDVPDPVIDSIVAEGDGERGFIPQGYVPGIDRDTRTVARPYLVIYTRDDAPDSFVRTLIQEYDRKRDYFRETHVNLSYDPLHVGLHAQAPLHPAALAYYREQGYPTD